jgi:hypothetical protein
MYGGGQKIRWGAKKKRVDTFALVLYDRAERGNERRRQKSRDDGGDRGAAGPLIPESSGERARCPIGAELSRKGQRTGI